MFWLIFYTLYVLEKYIGMTDIIFLVKMLFRVASESVTAEYELQSCHRTEIRKF